MKTEINCEVVGFSWGNIVADSQEFEQNPFNSSVFDIKGIASIAIRENEIVAIHPFERETLNKVAEKLSVAVTQYYKSEASVVIRKDSFVIQVSF